MKARKSRRQRLLKRHRLRFNETAPMKARKLAIIIQEGDQWDGFNETAPMKARKCAQLFVTGNSLKLLQ